MVVSPRNRGRRRGGRRVQGPRTATATSATTSTTAIISTATSTPEPTSAAATAGRSTTGRTPVDGLAAATAAHHARSAGNRSAGTDRPLPGRRLQRPLDTRNQRLHVARNGDPLHRRCPLPLDRRARPLLAGTRHGAAGPDGGSTNRRRIQSQPGGPRSARHRHRCPRRAPGSLVLDATDSSRPRPPSARRHYRQQEHRPPEHRQQEHWQRSRRYRRRRPAVPR